MAFQAGVSGNPSGRPKENAEVKELARKHMPRAIARLAEIMESDDERAAAAASTALLDRGYGKPPQALTGEDGAALQLIVQVAPTDPDL